MANEKIEIDIVLNDGSVAKGFASINKEAKKTESVLKGAFSVFTGIELSRAFQSITGATSNFFKSAIDEALEGERAVTKLTGSLKAANTFTDEAVKAFEDLAGELQDTTKYSDDQALSAAALARNFTKTNEQAAKLVRAAVELSTVFDQDLETSVTQLGGTFTGTAGRLAKLVPELGGLTSASLKTGSAIDTVLNKFKGAAENEVKSFGGALLLAKNQFNNFLESVGNAIIKNPTFLAAVNGLKDLFQGIFAGFSADKIDTKSLVDTLVIATAQGLAIVGKAAAYVVFHYNEAKAVVLSVFAAVLEINQKILDFDASLGRIANKVSLGLSDKDYKERQAAAENNRKLLEDVTKAGVEAASAQIEASKAYDIVTQEINKYTQSVKDASMTETAAAEKRKANFGTGVTPAVVDNKALEEAKLKLEEYRDKGFDVINEIYARIANLKTIDLSGTFESLGFALQLADADTANQIANITAKMNQFKERTLKDAEEIGNAIKNGLTNAIVGGIDALVSAVINGENAFKKFGNAILGIIGDLAKQIGTFIIAAGIAKLQLFSGNPVSTIAAGAALVAIGSALSAISKKGSEGGFAAAAGSSLTAPLTPAQPVSDPSESGNNRATVNLVVQGNVYDPQGTGLAIANLLKGAGFDGAVVV